MTTIKYPLISEMAYEGDFLFLYKEANISEDNDHLNIDGVQWLRNYISGTNKDPKSRKSAKKLLRQVFIAKEVFINGVRSLEGIVAKTRKFDDKNLLASIGFLNIVKEGGGKASDNRIIIKYLECHKDEIIEEIKSFKREGKILHIFLALGYSPSIKSTNKDFEKINNILALPSGFLLIPIPHLTRASYLSVAEAMILGKKYYGID